MHIHEIKLHLKFKMFIATAIFYLFISFSPLYASCGGPPPLPDIDTISPGVFSLNYGQTIKNTKTYNDTFVLHMKNLFSKYQHIGLARAENAHCIIDTIQFMYSPMSCTIEIEVLDSYKGAFVKKEKREIFLKDVSDGNEEFYNWIIGKEFLIYTNSIDSLPANIHAGCYSPYFGYYLENGRFSCPYLWIGPSISVSELKQLMVHVIRKTKKVQFTFDNQKTFDNIYTFSGKKIINLNKNTGVLIKKNGDRIIIIQKN